MACRCPVADPADLDAVNEAFQKGFTEEQGKEFASMVEFESHRDQILMIVHLRVPQAD
jgi:hypothetical protein